MRITILLNREARTEEGETLEEILKKCGHTIESVILLKEGKIILEEEILDKDTVELIPVASGG